MRLLPPVFPKGSGRGAGEGAEDPGEVVVVADAHGLGHGGDGQVVLQQQDLGRVDAPLGDEIGEGAAAGELLGSRQSLVRPMWSCWDTDSRLSRSM